MSQQPDPTIPFDASVVDEEGLRALRAVQRRLPVGDGGASGNLVGGTEAVAAFGMVPGAPAGGRLRAAHNMGAAHAEQMPAAGSSPLAPLEPTPSADMLTASRGELIGQRPIFVASSFANVAPKAATSHPPAGDSSSRPDIALAAEIAPAAPDDSEILVVTPPSVEKPEPEVPVDIAADAPLVHVSDAAGLEDQAIALDLSAALADTDGSEILSVSIHGVPEGASLSHGTRQPDGSWSVSPADLAHLSITPPRHFSGELDLTLRAVAQENSGHVAAVEVSFHVHVGAVADAPDVTVANAHGQEDTPVRLDGLGGALRDVDGSESLSFVLSGVPAGATLSAGVKQPDGSWLLTPTQLTGLTFTPPSQASGRFTLTLTAIATEGEAGVPSARTSATFTVDLDPVADAGTISGKSAGEEDTAILLKPDFMLPDNDGSESWSAMTQVAGLPAGASLSRGTQIAPGVWQVSTADLQAGLVTIRPAEHSDADFSLTLTATLTDGGNGTSVSRVVTGTHAVNVNAAADAPTVSAQNVTGHEDQPIPLDLAAALVDNDGSEALSVSILNVPPGAVLSHGTKQPDGSWSVALADLAHLSLTPPKDFSGTIDLTLKATARESENGTTATTTVPFQVRVTDVSDTPVLTVHNASGKEDTEISLSLSAALTDTDGSEEITISILNVPDGAKLSHGSKQPDGSWSVPVADLAHLTVTPPKNFSGAIDLTVEAMALSSNGAIAVTQAPVRVQVEAVADAPGLTVSDAAGREDHDIALDVSAALVDTDRSEVLSAIISNLPEGARLSAGLDNGDGTWTLTPDQLTGLKLIPAEDWSGTATLSVIAQARETSNGDIASTPGTLTVTVAALADMPQLGAKDVAGLEDQPIALDLSAAVTDRDGSESLTVLILDVPDGATLSHGTRQEDGSWSVPEKDLAHLSITPPRDFSGTINLTLRGTAHEKSGGDGATAEISFKVQVGAVADAPTVTVADAQGHEDMPVSLAGLGGALRDTGQSESLSFVLSGIPAGARLNAGIDNGDGTWTLTPDQLMGLTFTPPANVSGSYTLTLTAVATEKSNGSHAETSANFIVGINPVADNAGITGSVSGGEDTDITIKPAFALHDNDGSESWSEFTRITGVPTGATLKGSTSLTEVSSGVWQVSTIDLLAGRVTIKPPHDSDKDFTLTFTATQTDTGNGKSVSQEVTGTYDVKVIAVADVPTVVVANAQGYEDTPISLAGLGGALSDVDGSESLSFVLSGIPAGARLSAGIDKGNGNWKLTPDQLNGLTLTPPANFSGSLSLKLTAVATEGSDSQPTASTSAIFTVGVNPVLDNSRIGGSTSGDEDTDIQLKPVFSLDDNDKSETWSEFTQITGLPAGATLKGSSPILEDPTGVWHVSTKDLIAGRVTITPPHDSDEDFTLTFTATQEDTGNGTSVSRTVTGTYHVAVNAVADAPTITTGEAKGNEDAAIPLKLSAALTDTDGSEGLTVRIIGVPEGAKLSHGEEQPDGSWSVPVAHLAGLSITPPKDFSGTIKLTVEATATENEGGSQKSTSVDIEVKVEAVADTPELRVSPAFGDEDTEIPLHVTARATDLDGSETVVSYRLEGVPDGAIVRAGGKVLTVNADGKVTVPADLIGSLTIQPPADSDKDIDLKVVAISAEPNGSTAESPPKDLLVTVRADADAPVLNVTSASGPEDSDIPLNLTATLPDGDTSETLSFVISGLPKGAVLSAGTYRGPGTWSLTAEEARTVTLAPPANFSGKIDLIVTAVTQEGKGGDQASTAVHFPVHVDPVVDAPAVGGLDGKDAHWGTMSDPEDKPIELHFNPGLTDRDGSETVVGDIIIGNIPSGAVLRIADNSVVDVSPDGLYRIPVEKMAGITLTMPHNSDVAETLSIRMTIQDTDEDGKIVTKEISGHMVVNPRGVADEPVFTTQPSSGTGHNSTSDTAGWISLKINAELTDTDESESLSVWVRDVPAGASLSHGIPAGGGVWLVPADKLPSLAIRPPASSSGTISVIKLSVSVVVTEREGDEIVRSAPVEVTVTPPGSGGDGTGTGPGDGTGGTPVTGPKAQTPSLSVGSGSAASQEDQSVALSISAKTLDTDNGSETLGIRIDHVPEGARLSAGVRDPKTGSWVLRPDQLAGLELIPPHDFAGTITLNVTAVSTEKTGSEATQSSPLHITVEAVADGASISANPPAGREDVEIPLNLVITPNDGDGSETVVAVLLSGLPIGARIEGPGVTYHDNGTWSVNPADLKTVRMTPPPNWTGDLPLTITVTTQEASNDKTHTSSRNISIPVEAVPDAPTLSVAEASGQEDGAIELDVSASLVDTDKSEVLSVVISGLPEGARLTKGLNNGDGSWTLTPDQLTDLRLIPPADWSGAVNLTVRAHAREISNGEVATTERTLTVQVEAEADAPVVSARDVTGREDLPIALDLSARLTDRDGSEVLSVSIDGVPVGASLSHGTRQADGSWSVSPTDLPHLTLTAPQNFSGTFDLTLRATTQETLGGRTSSSAASFRVKVDAIADAPDVTVVDFSGHEDMPISLAGLGGALRDTDQSESLSFMLSGIPAGARLNAGTDNGDGTWTLTPDQLMGLTFTPPVNVSGSYTLTLTGTATESAGGPAASTARSFTVEFKPVVDAATISGMSTGGEDTDITIKPTFTLQDKDGSETWSEFTEVSGLPVGATLNLGQELTPGTWQVSTAALQAGLVKIRPAEHSDADFTLTLTAVVTDSGNGKSVIQTVTGTHAVTVSAVADEPVVSAKNVSGQEDQAIALDLSAALADKDGSETLSVSILGVPEGFKLSHGTSVGGGVWQVTADSLSGLKLIPADDANGTFNLTLQATSRETSGGHTTTTTASFTVTIDPVNDAPNLVLTAPQHATEGAHQADLIGNAQASDIDSSHLGGATITLSGAQPHDRLGFEGFTLRTDGERTMIGSTGIEVVGGGYAAGSGTLTLRGSASPGTYAAVLESLVLESGDPSGLAAGTRSIGVVLCDSAGAESIQRSVDVVVDEVPLAQPESHGMAQTAGSENASGGSAADILLLMSDDMSVLNSDSNAAWTEQVEAGNAHEVATHHDSHLDQPGTDHIQIVDDLQAETLRVSWH